MKRERGKGASVFACQRRRSICFGSLPHTGAMRSALTRRWVLPCVAAGLLLLAGGRVVAVGPGDVITAEKADLVAEQVSPAVLWCVRHGMNLSIVAHKQIVLPKAYTEATERFAGQVKLSSDGLRIDGYVAGQPFPNLDTNDPALAAKIMWNYYYRGYFTDDYTWRNFEADTGPITNNGLQIERHYVIRDNGRLYFKGRLYVDPKPELPNPEGIHYKEITGPILSPLDLKGAGQLNYRFLDLDQHDRTWLYLPSLRRVRRLSSAQRSDSVFGQDTDVDSYMGYAGNIGWMTWSYLGQKTMLAPYHAQHSPVQFCPPPGDFGFCDNWEPREAYILEGVSKLPQYAFSKRVLFIDKETYTVLYSDLYDRGGRLWKVWINDWRAADRASSHPGVTVYPDEQLFNPAFIMVDLQLNHATRSWTPTANSATGEEEFFNVGGEKSGIPEASFAMSHLIEAGR
jgi:hypothetical protein